MNNQKIKLEKSWFNILKDEFEKPYMKNLKIFLSEDIKNNVVYPDLNLIFNSFNQTPFNKVKVVIIGQDPYHGEGQAHGLCFSVKKGITTPPSLKNIFKEIKEDVNTIEPSHGDLTYWSKQGVLLLNATLTVRKKSPKSHFGKGWEIFTDFVVDQLAKKKDPIVFLLWGQSAKNKILNVFKNFDNLPHLVLEAAHPSFYSVAGFWGCKHFSKTNKFLEKNKKKPIDWNIK